MHARIGSATSHMLSSPLKHSMLVGSMLSCFFPYDTASTLFINVQYTLFPALLHRKFCFREEQQLFETGFATRGLVMVSA